MTADQFDRRARRVVARRARPPNVEALARWCARSTPARRCAPARRMPRMRTALRRSCTTLRPDPDLLVAAQLFGVYDVLRDPDEWLRCALRSDGCAAVAGPAAADAALRTDTGARGATRTEPSGRPARRAAPHAAGDGERPARRAAAAGIAPADAALTTRSASGLASRADRARDAGSVRATGEPARRLAAQVGARGPVVPVPRARNLQVRLRALLDEQAHRARVVHRRGSDAPAPHGRRGRIARRGQRPPEAHLQHLEQDARQGSRLRAGLRRARAACHRRRSGAVLSGACHWCTRPGRSIEHEYDDYIARPKPNGYQSLHTVVRDAAGRTLEVQIRTRRMHEHAELGVAAHWRYKEGGKGRDDDEQRVAWLRQLLAWRRRGRCAAGQRTGRATSASTC